MYQKKLRNIKSDTSANVKQQEAPMNNFDY